MSKTPTAVVSPAGSNAALPSDAATTKPSAPNGFKDWLQRSRQWLQPLHGGIIMLYVLSILAWSVPGNAPLVARVRHIVEPFFVWSGIWQGWDMFSPNPLADNVWVEAELTMTDGSKKIWTFPRMDKMGNWDKFRYERYRKWAIDRVRVDSYSGIWPETARYIARIFYDDPAGPPREITLVRHWRTIKSPTEQWIAIGQEDTLPEQHYAFFHYTVQPADIEPPVPGAR